jgi:hypothetical protein
MPVRVAGHHISRRTGVASEYNKKMQNRGNEAKKLLKTNCLLFLEVKNEAKTNPVPSAFGALRRENSASFRTSREQPRLARQVIRRETGGTMDCSERTGGSAQSVILSCARPASNPPPGAPSGAQPNEIGNPRPTPPPAGAFH